MLFAILNGCLIAFLALYADFYQIGSAAYFFVINALVMFVTRIIFSRWADLRTLASAALYSGLCLILSMVFLGLGRSRFFMLAAGASFGFGYGMLLPVTQAKSVQAPPLERRNAGSNTYYIGIDTGFALGNFFAGNIAGVIGYANMYLCLIFPALLAVGLAFWKGQMSAKEQVCIQGKGKQ
jgi:MFS family permease